MLRFINLFMMLAMIVMNYLANALPLNNKTTGELSDSYPNLFVPAGITFSIWGVIYLLLFIVIIYQFTGQGREQFVSTGWFFAASCLFNILWIFAWHYQKLPLSLLAMAGLLVVLILLNARIKVLDNALLKAAFGIYLGWICIATIANVTAFLVSIGWEGFGIPDGTWTIIMIGIGSLIVVFTILKAANPWVGLAVIWAFAGIIIKRQADFRAIVITAALGIIIVTVITVISFLRRPA